MANKNSKANKKSKEKAASATNAANQYEQKRERLNNGARIMAFLAAGIFLFD